MHDMFQTRALSSLAKVFGDEEPRDMPFSRATALQGETFAFQVAYRSGKMIKPLTVRAESPLDGAIAIRTVGLVPSELPCFDDADADSLRTTPGLYPDPLYPLEAQPPRALPGQWRAVWVTVNVPESAAGGTYPIRILFEQETGEKLGEETFALTVVAQRLPKQRLLHTEWFHADCIAMYYGCEVFGEEHWRRLEQYIGTAAAHGINMLLTPLFTPPLDTEVGGERPTVQLVDVTLEGGRYRFGFDRLKR